jgi:hypothetical protein
MSVEGISKSKDEQLKDLKASIEAKLRAKKMGTVDYTHTVEEASLAIADLLGVGTAGPILEEIEAKIKKGQV